MPSIQPWSACSADATPMNISPDDYEPCYFLIEEVTRSRLWDNIEEKELLKVKIHIHVS